MRKFVLDSLNDLMRRQIDWRLSGEKTLGQHLGRLRPPSEEAECVTMHATRQAGGKNKHIFLPSCPCGCPSAVSSSMDQRDVGHNTGAQSPTHTVSLLKMTQQRSGCWAAPLQLHPACIHPPSLPPPSPGYILPYLPVWSTSLTIWISACLRFSPPTLPASPLSRAPLWLPASTFPNTQPPYLPPQTTLCRRLAPFTLTI